MKWTNHTVHTRESKFNETTKWQQRNVQKNAAQMNKNETKTKK